MTFDEAVKAGGRVEKMPNGRMVVFPKKGGRGILGLPVNAEKKTRKR